jgi:PST family polysaccharide transporter
MKGLGAKLAGGAAMLGLTQIARIGLTILSTIIVARILLPSDYGVMAMVGPIVALTTMFQEMGFSSATIQREKLTEEESSAIFWLSQFATLILAIILLVAAPLVGQFYGDPRPGYLTAASAGMLVVSGLSLQHAARLNRDMRYGVMSMADLANGVAAFAVTLACALWLRSYWALFLGSLAGAVIQSVLMWHYSAWRPALRPSIAAASSFLRFGGNLTAYNFLNYLVRNMDNVLIARFEGSSALGLYDRSYRLMAMPIQNLNAPIWRLLLPVLSRLTGEPDRYREVYLLAVRLLVLTTVPAFAVTATMSTEVTVLLLGEKWAAAGPIFFWLSVAGMFQPLSNMMGLLLVSRGRSGVMLGWGIFAAITTLLGFAAGLWSAGAVGVAASVFFVGTLRAPILYHYATKDSPVRQGDLYKACVAPLLGGAAGGALAVSIPMVDTLPRVMIGILLAYGVAILCTSMTVSGRATLAYVLRAIRPMLRRNASAPTTATQGRIRS